jgi:hypothetical protein
MFMLTQLTHMSPPGASDLHDIIEYSSESLLHNCYTGNLTLVREILHNGDFHLNHNRRYNATTTTG